MKRHLIFLSVPMLIAACNGLREDSVKKFIPGTYIRYSEHEYGKEYDTLVITNQKDQFQIQRRWRYERVLDGMTQEPEYKHQATTAFYDAEQRLLRESETGNTINFEPKENILIIGSTKYKKVK